MNILHVCKKYPPVMGGDAVVVANLQKQQVASNHNVVIVTSNCQEVTNTPGVYKVGLKDTSIGLDAITPRRIASLIILFFRMFNIVRTERPDVIHTHSVDMAFFASFAARLYGVPIIHTFHIVTFYDDNQSSLRRKSELWLAKKTNPRYITAPNNYDVNKLRAAGLNQTVLLPNGVDIDFWKPSIAATRPKTFTFLAVGRLEPQKGYEYLVRAAALLAQQQTDFRVVIVGEGSQKTTLSTLARDLKVRNIVQFAGGKKPAEVQAMLAQANAVVCPSLYETTPLTLLEAWSAAVPVIITPVGILRDVPTDFAAAFVVPPKDDAALMQAMGHCMTDEVQRIIVAAKGHKEAKNYAWPIINETTEALYGHSL